MRTKFSSRAGRALMAGLGLTLGLRVTWAAPLIPDVRGRMDTMLMPVPERAGADAAWAEIAGILAVVPKLSVGSFSSPKTPMNWSGYILVQEIANRTLREAGLRFCRQFPDDPRRWVWLEATMDRLPQYADAALALRAQTDPAVAVTFDDAARAAWQTDFSRLRDQCIASEQASEEFRVRLWGAKIAEPLDAEMWARAVKKPFDIGTIDFERLGAELDALGRKFPRERSNVIRVLARNFLAMAEKHAPDIGSFRRTALKTSPNEMLRDLAGGSDALAEARVRPMEMRFTAIDGREVDLAKLRGKVVLIDFRGVTWCGACREEEPYMKDAYAKYRDQGFEIITITYETKTESRAFVLNYLKERSLTWPAYFDGQGENNPYIKRYGITAVPQHFLIDRQGLLATTDVRSRKLEPAVRRLLGLSALPAKAEAKDAANGGAQEKSGDR